MATRSLAIVASAWDQPAVRFTHQHLVGHEHVVEEHLVEMLVTTGRPRRPDPDARERHVDQEVPDALVLLDIRIGAGQQRPVGALRRGRPDLLAVDPPPTGDLGRPGRQRRQVGSGTGLGKELAPTDLTAHGGHGEAVTLLIGARGEHGGQDPLRDPQRGPYQIGPLVVLLVDDQLLGR